MGSDLTYAVVGGVLENILMGFDARDAKKKQEAEDAAKKAEKEAENLFTNSNNLVTHLSHKDNRGAAVSFIHGTAVPNSPASMVYNSLDAYQQMQISTNAMGHLPDQLQEVLTQAATSVEAARSLAQDQTILQMFSTSPMAMAQLSAYAAKPLSAQEQAIIDGAPKSADVQVQLAYYNSQKVIYPTGTPAGDYLDSVIKNLGAIKPEREYTSIADTVKGIEDSIRNELTDAKDGEREPSLVPLLSQIRALKANVASFAIDPEYAEGEEIA